MLNKGAKCVAIFYLCCYVELVISTDYDYSLEPNSVEKQKILSGMIQESQCELFSYVLMKMQETFAIALKGPSKEQIIHAIRDSIKDTIQVEIENAIRIETERQSTICPNPPSHNSTTATGFHTFGTLNKLGLSCSYQTVTSNLDSLVASFDKKLLKNKQEWSSQLQSALLCQRIDVNEHNEDFMSLAMTQSLDHLTTVKDNEKPGCSRKLIFSEDEVNTDGKEMFKGGIFTVDNISHLPQTLHYGSNSKPTMINITNVAFIYNRIPQAIQEIVKPQIIKNAIDVELNAYIPSMEDMLLIKEDHTTLIKRILVKHLPYFKNISNDSSIVWYKPHMYTDESKGKSQSINMGLIDSDGSTTEGTKQIAAFVKQYA